MPPPDKQQIADWFASLQDDICQQIEDADEGERFFEDAWQRPGGGGGRSRVLQEGRHIEKGGVNFSAVFGAAPEPMARQMQLTEPTDFYATGVSIVLHPRSPMVPIIHMNVRYFELSNGTHWFGGGIDLTPHYVNEADARYFHGQLKATCDAHHPDYYPRFKAWADDYFYIRHRHETRGIGGIFFDNLMATDEATDQQRWAFVRAVGECFAPTYRHLLRQHANQPFGERQRHWQLLRRGRYAEFNLVWDRGTRFGLETDGRTESILMSLPPQANWQYNFQPEADSPERATLDWLRKGVDWTTP